MARAALPEHPTPPSGHYLRSTGAFWMMYDGTIRMTWGLFNGVAHLHTEPSSPGGSPATAWPEDDFIQRISFPLKSCRPLEFLVLRHRLTYLLFVKEKYYQQ